MSSNFLPIETERLILRNFELTDLDAVMSYYNEPDVQRYLDWKVRDKGECRQALDIMHTQVSLQRPGDTLSRAIVRKDNNVLIGQVSLRWADATAGQGELRFAMHPKFRGRGYATEAVKAMLDLAFDHFHIHRVFARLDARNNRSVKLMHRIGMRLEAHYREHALFQGEWDEELHFAILDREWRRNAKVRELPLNHLVA